MSQEEKLNLQLKSIELKISKLAKDDDNALEKKIQDDIKSFYCLLKSCWENTLLK